MICKKLCQNAVRFQCQILKMVTKKCNFQLLSMCFCYIFPTRTAFFHHVDGLLFILGQRVGFSLNLLFIYLFILFQLCSNQLVSGFESRRSEFKPVSRSRCRFRLLLLVPVDGSLVLQNVVRLHLLFLYVSSQTTILLILLLLLLSQCWMYTPLIRQNITS